MRMKTLHVENDIGLSRWAVSFLELTRDAMKSGHSSCCAGSASKNNATNEERSY